MLIDEARRRAKLWTRARAQAARRVRGEGRAVAAGGGDRDQRGDAVRPEGPVDDREERRRAVAALDRSDAFWPVEGVPVSDA